jgi:hypothetical protein
MPRAKVTPVRFSEEELALLDVIQGHTGIRSRLQAMKEVLRYYAEAEGLKVDKPKKASPPRT